MDFKVVYLICAGLDVHKKSVTAAVCITNPLTLQAKYIVKKFRTTNAGIEELRDWLLAQHCHDVCMESTGKYWIPIFNILEKEIHVILTHPKYVKAIKGKKTDKRDAKWIANLFRFDIVKSSFIPPPEIRALREFVRYRLKLSYMRTAEKNRYQNSMTVSNIRLDCFLTDPFGKTATAIMSYLLSDEPFDEQRCEKMIHANVKASHEEILESIRGCRITDEQKVKMNLVSQHMDYIDTSIYEIEKKLSELSQPYEELVARISRIAGFTEKSALFIISEIGTDMSVFESDKHLCSWAGLVPANNESADKKKSTRCSKAGRYLKPLLVQCALSAVKSCQQPYYKIKYQRLSKRRGKKKAIIAIARMMLTAVYHMIKDGTEFCPSDYEAIVHPSKEAKKEFTMENIIKYLGEQGADPETLKQIQQQCAAANG